MSAIGTPQQHAGFAATSRIGINGDTQWSSQDPIHLQSPQTLTVAKKGRRNSLTTLRNKRSDPDYVPRPLNSFFLFRNDYVRRRPKGTPTPGMSLSKLVGEAWKSLPLSEKKKWEKKADEVSTKHARDNPTYKFKPGRYSKTRRGEHSRLGKKPNTSLITFHANPTASVLLPDNSLPHIMRRKESHRLDNWDDSVLYPTPYAASFSSLFDGQLYQIPESLRRRSSSVPIPEANSNQTISPPFPEQYPAPPSYPYFPDIGRRLSYSGIRAGFMPFDMFPSAPSYQTPYSDSPEHQSQALLNHQSDPSNMFEGYKITYIPTTTDSHRSARDGSQPPRHGQQLETFFRNPFNSHMRSGSDAASKGQEWESPRGLDVPPGVLYNDVLDSRSPQGSHANSSLVMQSFEATNVSAARKEPSHRLNSEENKADRPIEHVGLIDSDNSLNQVCLPHADSYPSAYDAHLEPLTPLDDLSASTPLSVFFSQHARHFGGFQLSASNSWDDMPMDPSTIVTSQYPESNPEHSLQFEHSYSPQEKFDINDEFLNFPTSGAASSGSSTSDSSPYSKQLDFESLAGQ